MEELLESWIFRACCSVAKDNLRGQGIGIQPDRVNKTLWVFQQAQKHSFVLEVLVRDVILCGCDIQGIMYNFPDCSPKLSVFLYTNLSI